MLLGVFHFLLSDRHAHQEIMLILALETTENGLFWGYTFVQL